MSRAAVAKRCRINNWDDHKDDILLGLLKEQYLLGCGTAGQFPNVAWHAIVKAFNHKTDLSYRSEHLRNRLKVLKRSYSLYHDVVRRNGWKWDPVRNVPTPQSPSQWNDIISVNPEYAKCRDIPFLRYKDLDFLHRKKTEEASSDNSMADGDDLDVDEANDFNSARKARYSTKFATTSTNTELPKHRKVAKPQFMPNHFPDPAPHVAEALSEEELAAFPPERHITFAVPLSYCRRKRPRDKRGLLSKLLDVERRRVEIYREQLDRTIASRPNVYSIEDCIKKLEKVDAVSPEVFAVVCDVFKDQDRRTIFMNLEGPCLMAWIQHRVKVEMGHVPGSNSQHTPVSEKTNSVPPATPTG